MARHSGLKYVLETKKGYVKDDGSFTNIVDEAKLIDFTQFGFVLSATDVYKMLGFYNQEVIESGVSFKTVIPSYEARYKMGIKYYLLMDYDYERAYLQSKKDCDDFKLYNDDNCLKYDNVLKAKVLSYCQKYKVISQGLKTTRGDLPLYETNIKDMIVLGGTLKQYYSNMGMVYRYSIPLRNHHVERFFDMNEEELNYYNHFSQRGLEDYFLTRFNAEKFSLGLHIDTEILNLNIFNDELVIYLNDWNNWNDFAVAKGINSIVSDFYFMREMYIMKVFGSYVIVQSINGKLIAVKSTPVPDEDYPLMVKFLKEAGEERLLTGLDASDIEKQSELMSEFINQFVIPAGYFDNNRFPKFSKGIHIPIYVMTENGWKLVESDTLHQGKDLKLIKKAL